MKNKHLADMDREELKHYIFKLQEFIEQEKKDGKDGGLGFQICMTMVCICIHGHI